MSSVFDNVMRSSVEGKAVRLYTSFRAFSCSALVRFFFPLMVGSSGKIGTGGGEYDWEGAAKEELKEERVEDPELLWS